MSGAYYVSRRPEIASGGGRAASGARMFPVKHCRARREPVGIETRICDHNYTIFFLAVSSPKVCQGMLEIVTAPRRLDKRVL
jgi:hypothetical protein